MATGREPPPPTPPSRPPDYAPPDLGPAARPLAGGQSVEVQATLALVLGILGLCCWPVGPAALLLGLQARRRIQASDGQLAGDGRATAGLVLGLIDTVFVLLGLGAAVLSRLTS